MVDVGNKLRRSHVTQMKRHFAPVIGESWRLHYHRMADAEPGAEQGDWTVERILRHRRKADGTLEFLVRWSGCGPEGDQWEPVSASLPTMNDVWAGYCAQHQLNVPGTQLLAFITAPSL